MNKHTASTFSKKFISLRSSWSYCKDSFAEIFERLLQQGAFLESGPGEKIWGTRTKYVLKLPAGENFDVVYKGYRKISKVYSYLLRPSPCGLEAVNYQRISDLGITLPELLAAGETRSFHLLKGAFIITRFAEEFEDGRAFLPGAPLAGEEKLKEEFLRRHLELLARCHDERILHRGFTPANIMWKKRSAPDIEGNALDLLWIDLASCRRLPLWLINRKCYKDLALCLKPFGFSREQYAYFIELYCAARKKVPPQLQVLKAELLK